MIDANTPIGTPVIVRTPGGVEVRSRTKAQPYWLVKRRARRAGTTSEDRLVVVIERIGVVECDVVWPVAERQLDLFGGVGR